MKPSDLKKLIAARFNAVMKRPLHIEGSPGVGKTQIAAQIAKELGVGFKVVHAPLLQPEDYSLPVPSADRLSVNFIVSKEKFPLEDSDCPDTGIFLIDELPQSDNHAQKILRNLIQEREIHGKRLKPGWTIITTGNRQADRAGANRLLSHLSNVLTRVELEPSLDDWTQWALGAGIKPEVIAFIRFRPELLNNFDAHAEINATPRAWAEGVSPALGVIDPLLEHVCFKGDVGDGPASEFLGFLKIFRKLPSPDAILLNPKGSPVPVDSSATLYAICAALAHRATADNFDRLMQYIMRIPEEYKKFHKQTGGAEYTVLFVKDAIRLTERTPKDVQLTKAFIDWASKYGTELLGG